MPRISIQHLDFSYADGAQDYPALQDVSLKIEDGEFICVVGHSGCGKTTLLDVLAGLQKPTKGTVVIGDTPITNPGPDRAVVFQHYSLFPWMTAYHNVLFGINETCPELDKAQASKQARCVLESVGMADSADKYPYQLSGGMQQRVAIARMIAMNAETLLLDEPFGALDAATRSDLQCLLEKLWLSGKKRNTIVFVTHDVEEAILLADRIVFMRFGRVENEFSLSFERPRDREEIIASASYRTLRSRILDLFQLDRRLE